MRKLLIGLAAVVAIGAAAAVFLWSNLDSLVKTSIERAGTRVAGVPVRVGNVKISLADGSASLDRLTIANPKGFSNSPAISLGHVTVAIDKASIGKNPVVIKAVAVSEPAIAYEIGSAGSNIDAIRNNVRSFAAAHGGRGGDESSGDDGDKKLVIDLLTIHGAKVAFATPLRGGQANATIGDIRLAGIGRANNGATPSEIASQVLSAISSSVAGGVPALKAGSPQAQDAVNQIRGLLGK